MGTEESSPAVVRMTPEDRSWVRSRSARSSSQLVRMDEAASSGERPPVPGGEQAEDGGLGGVNRKDPRRRASHALL